MKKRKLLSLLLAGGLLCGIVCSCGPTSEETSSTADSGTSSAESLSASSSPITSSQGSGEESSSVSSAEGESKHHFIVEMGDLKGYEGPGGEVVFPETVTHISNGMLLAHTVITSLTLPKSFTGGITKYPSGEYPHTGLACLNWGGYGRWEPLTEIKVAEGNETFCAVDGVLFTKDMKTLLLYPRGKTDTEYTIPDGVEEIATGAFLYSRNLQKLTVPASIKYLGRYAFSRTYVKVTFLGDRPKDVSGSTGLEPTLRFSEGPFEDKVYTVEDLPNVTMDELEWLWKAANAKEMVIYPRDPEWIIDDKGEYYDLIENATSIEELNVLQRRYYFTGVKEPIHNRFGNYIEQNGKLYRREFQVGLGDGIPPILSIEMDGEDCIKAYAPYLTEYEDEPHQATHYLYFGVEDGRLKIKKIEAFYNGESVMVG